VEQSLSRERTIVPASSRGGSGQTWVDPDDEFGAAMIENGDHLARLAFFLCGDRGRAEDVVSEAFAATWPKWTAGRVDNLVPYLKRAVVNLASKERRHWVVVHRYEQTLVPQSSSPGADEGLGPRIDLTRALASVPSAQRVVLVLRYFEDMSEAEIATLLGVALGTVKSRLARALDTLRDRMKGENNA
jgi:RNA polymerase sigma-70 factor (sigma-E family)